MQELLKEWKKFLKEQEIPSYEDRYADQKIDPEKRAIRNDVQSHYGSEKGEDYKQRAIQHVTQKSIFKTSLTPELINFILNGEPEPLADYITSQVKSHNPNEYEKYIYEQGVYKLEKKIVDFLEKANRYALAGEKSGSTKQQAIENQKQAYTLAKRFASRITLSPKDFETFLFTYDKYEKTGREIRRIMELAKTGIMTADGGMKMGLPTTGKFNPDGTEKASPLQEKKLTKPQAKKKEKFVMGMKSAKKDFEKRYPGRGEEVMYATATKMAKKKKKKKED